MRPSSWRDPSGWNGDGIDPSWNERRTAATKGAGICVASRAVTSRIVNPAGTTNASVFDGDARIERISPKVAPVGKLYHPGWIVGSP